MGRSEQLRRYGSGCFSGVVSVDISLDIHWMSESVRSALGKLSRLWLFRRTKRIEKVELIRGIWQTKAHGQQLGCHITK